MFPVAHTAAHGDPEHGNDGNGNDERHKNGNETQQVKTGALPGNMLNTGIGWLQLSDPSTGLAAEIRYCKRSPLFTASLCKQEMLSLMCTVKIAADQTNVKKASPRMSDA
jgi:hypothetical protein